jgi:hypothetical protein
LLPDRCSIRYDNKDCSNPPSYVVSIVHDSGEYMVGVVCEEHRSHMESRVNIMQGNGEIPKGNIKFAELKSVGTDCIANYQNDPDNFL